MHHVLLFFYICDFYFNCNRAGCGWVGYRSETAASCCLFISGFQLGLLQCGRGWVGARTQISAACCLLNIWNSTSDVTWCGWVRSRNETYMACWNLTLVVTGWEGNGLHLEERLFFGFASTFIFSFWIYFTFKLGMARWLIILTQFFSKQFCLYLFTSVFHIYSSCIYMYIYK